MTSNRLWCVLALFFMLTSIGLAQDGRFNISVTAGEAFGKDSNGEGVALSPTNSPVYVGTIAMRVAPKIAVEFNFGHAKIAQKYSTSGLDYRIPSTVSEFSGDVAFRPFRHGKFSPFVFAGAGALVFNPSDALVNDVEAAIGEQRQYRPSFLYGVGTDYHLVSRFSFRLQYRGLLYSAPDFKVQPLFTGQKGHTAEVCAGLVFNF